MSWFNRKQTPRRVPGSRPVGGRPLPKPSVLENQKVSPRPRKKPASPVKVDNQSVVRATAHRRVGGTELPLMVRLLENGLIMAAGVSMAYKRARVVVGALVDRGQDLLERIQALRRRDDAMTPDSSRSEEGDGWRDDRQPAESGWRDDRQPAESGWRDAEPLGTDGRLEGSLEPDGRGRLEGLDESADLDAGTDGRIEPDLDAPFDGETEEPVRTGGGLASGPDVTGLKVGLVVDDTVLPVLREEVEGSKMAVLEDEEHDLPEEELVDQAGALRSLLANNQGKS